VTVWTPFELEQGTVEISVLGNLEVLLEGTGMYLGTPKQQIVLAMPAVHAGPHGDARNAGR
jgi:hypothetical protein